MRAGVTAQSRDSFWPAARSLAGVAVAMALLLQALFAVPLALRMVADLSWQAETGLCTAATDGTAAAGDHRSDQKLPVHGHAQCLICQAHALPIALLAVVLCVLLAAFGQAVPRHAMAEALLWRRERYRTYHSRAPPLAA